MQVHVCGSVVAAYCSGGVLISHPELTSITIEAEKPEKESFSVVH